MRFIDLFAGCGGMSKGLEMAGLECVGFVEFWQPAINTFQKNCGGKLIGKDIIQIEDEEIQQFKNIGLVCGGPPCQGFSLAGKRSINDPRNRLFLEFVRFVRIIKPKFFVMENVLGIGSMRNPEGKVVLKEIFNCFEEIGYKVEAKILDSSNYLVPQKRRRVIFLGNNQGLKNVFPKYKGKVFLKEVLNLPYEEDEKIQHFCRKRRKKYNYTYSHVKQGDSYGLFRSAVKKLKMDGFSCTITKSGMYIHPGYNRLISVRESARIQSFPDDFMFCGSVNQMYAQIGNAVPVLMAKAIGEGIREQLNEK